MLSIKLPRRLQSVPELGPYEINVGALSQVHVGLIVVVRRGRNVLTGPLMYIPGASQVKPLLVLQIGDFSTGLHPAAKVMVIPDGYRATITVARKPAPTTKEQQR